MKNLFALAFLIMLTINSYGQTDPLPSLINLTLRYNIAQSRYEVYGRPTFSAANFNWGSAQVSIVAPAGVPNSAFTVTSVAGGGWDDVSQVYGPSVASAFDFHGIGSPGKKTDLVANQELLLFHFTIPGNTCVAGLRLFINGSDPVATASGMNGGDFTNVIYSINTNQQQTSLYQLNYDNTGTTCTTCNLVAATLSK
ncbi:hypothetical protein [Spirosoma linguale]|uniref:Uncharacterized protein n=1 Tax=Spirosoma linguale (strain ATCC 33905 / DSM 74 / LMG 10896 / Claus 1) TaxID=504472 RepID=D2QCD3_SPILD|nr:hypothetical protein Slin_0179 [Spirosoma linguale DSM 74]